MWGRQKGIRQAIIPETSSDHSFIPLRQTRTLFLLLSNFQRLHNLHRPGTIQLRNFIATSKPRKHAWKRKWTEQIRILITYSKQGLFRIHGIQQTAWKAAVWTPGMADVKGRSEQKKGLTPEAGILLNLLYIGRTSNPSGSLFIEGEARPNLSMHFCILLVDIEADRNTVL